jgi:hypothetical protein
MRALIYRRYGGPDVLELTDVPPPEPREREVLLRVHAASINAADRVILRGKPLLVRFGTGLSRPNRTILGFGRRCETSIARAAAEIDARADPGGARPHGLYAATGAGLRSANCPFQYG